MCGEILHSEKYLLRKTFIDKRKERNQLWEYISAAPSHIVLSSVDNNSALEIRILFLNRTHLTGTTLSETGTDVRIFLRLYEILQALTRINNTEPMTKYLTTTC